MRGASERHKENGNNSLQKPRREWLAVVGLSEKKKDRSREGERMTEEGGMTEYPKVLEREGVTERAEA